MKPSHFIVLAIVLLVVFGASKLPDIAKSFGQSAKVLKKELRELQEDDAAEMTGQRAAQPAAPGVAPASTPSATPASTPSAAPTFTPGATPASTPGAAPADAKSSASSDPVSSERGHVSPGMGRVSPELDGSSDAASGEGCV